MGSPIRLPILGPLRSAMIAGVLLLVCRGWAQDTHLKAYLTCMDSCNTAELAGTYERALLLLEKLPPIRRKDELAKEA